MPRGRNHWTCHVAHSKFHFDLLATKPNPPLNACQLLNRKAYGERVNPHMLTIFYFIYELYL